MPAGSLIAADYQLELRATLMGDGTNYPLRSDRTIDGLGVPNAKTADVELDQADGSYGSPDYLGVRVLLIPFVFEGTPSQVGGWIKDMHTVWAPSTTDIPLYMQLPGFGKFHVNGRPRGFDADIQRIQFGIATAEATFVALDPTITYP